MKLVCVFLSVYICVSVPYVCMYVCACVYIRVCVEGGVVTKEVPEKQIDIDKSPVPLWVGSARN